jgi:hypothetical protein
MAGMSDELKERNISKVILIVRLACATLDVGRPIEGVLCSLGGKWPEIVKIQPFHDFSSSILTFALPAFGHSVFMISHVFSLSGSDIHFGDNGYSAVANRNEW